MTKDEIINILCKIYGLPNGKSCNNDNNNVDIATIIQHNLNTVVEDAVAISNRNYDNGSINNDNCGVNNGVNNGSSVGTTDNVNDAVDTAFHHIDSINNICLIPSIDNGNNNGTTMS